MQISNLFYNNTNTIQGKKNHFKISHQKQNQTLNPLIFFISTIIVIIIFLNPALFST